MSVKDGQIARPRGAKVIRSYENFDKLPDHEKPPISHGYCKGADGTRLFYSTEGRGKPLIFCYGLVCSSLHWTYQIEYFSHFYRTLWFDYRGHHYSDKPKDLSTMNLRTIAEDLKLIMDELELEEAVILGHSMGVNVALETARLLPDRIKGLVLSNGTAKRPLETIMGTNVFQMGFEILRKAHAISPWAVQKIWNLQKDNSITQMLIALAGFNPHLTHKDDVKLYVNQIADMDPAVFVNLIGNYSEIDCSSWLHTVECPSLIISGEEDKVIPLKLQQHLHQLIPNSLFETIEHGSHCPQMDLPELFNAKVEHFLKSLDY